MTPDKPVEETARAAFDACYGDTHIAGWTMAENKPTDASEELKERFRKMARAALAVALEACAKVAEESSRANCEARQPHCAPFLGRGRRCPECPRDEGEDIAARVRDLLLPPRPE